MKICAIIVSYYPTDELIENVDALINQVDEIVIVDNGSGLATKQLLDKLIKQHSKLNVIFLQENLGIAAALNIGIQKAKAADYEWVITFDQDSQVTPFMIETMLHAYDLYPNKEIVASLSPQYKNKETSKIRSIAFPFSDDLLTYVETKEVMASGQLIKLSVFDTVGYFNEKLFIDSVDIDHCLRCITENYKILKIKNAILLHSAGFPSRHKLLWLLPLTTSNHSPLRRYYIARNSLHTYKKFFFKQPLWTTIKICKFSASLIVMLLFENERKKKLVATFLGFWDFFLGRMGKCTRDNFL